MTFTVLDGVFTGIVLIALILGLVKGFYSLVTSTIKFIAAIALTFLFAGPIIDAFTGPFFQLKISEAITESIITKYPEISAANAAETLPIGFKIMAFLGRVDLNNISVNSDAGESIATALGQSIGNPVGNIVAFIVTYLAMFIVISIILKILIGILGKILTFGPLKAVDKLLGVAFTVAVSSILCCIIATITVSASPEFTGGFVFDFFRSLNPF